MDEPTIYCEWLNGALHQPINTLSNIVFILVAVFLYQKIRQSDTEDWLIKLFPFSILFIGISSGLWHYEISNVGDVLDTLSIAIFALLISLVIFKKLFFQWISRSTAIVGVVMVALYLEQLPHLNGSLVYLFLFTTLGFSLYVLSTRNQANFKPALVAVSLLLVGLLARIVDIHVCSSLEIGTHFVWHITIALATYFIIVSLLITQPGSSKAKYDRGSLGIFYPLWRKLNNPNFYKHLIKEAVGKLKLKSGERVLEIACGPGYTLEFLSNDVGKNGSVLATDYSERMLLHAQQTVDTLGLTNVTLQKVDAATITYDKEFDAAVVVLGLSVIPEWEKALSQITKAVKPGGKIVIVDSKLTKHNVITNFFVQLLFFWVAAEDRNIRDAAKKLVHEVEYLEYKKGLYFLFVGEIK